MRNCQILAVFQRSLLQIHLRSGAARILNDFFRIRIHPAKSFGSGSTTHDTWQRMRCNLTLPGSVPDTDPEAFVRDELRNCIILNGVY
jgi:hypothetical protein